MGICLFCFINLPNCFPKLPFLCVQQLLEPCSFSHTSVGLGIVHLSRLAGLMDVVFWGCGASFLPFFPFWHTVMCSAKPALNLQCRWRWTWTTDLPFFLPSGFEIIGGVDHHTGFIRCWGLSPGVGKHFRLACIPVPGAVFCECSWHYLLGRSIDPNFPILNFDFLTQLYN